MYLCLSHYTEENFRRSKFLFVVRWGSKFLFVGIKEVRVKEGLHKITLSVYSIVKWVFKRLSIPEKDLY